MPVVNSWEVVGPVPRMPAQEINCTLLPYIAAIGAIGITGLLSMIIYEVWM